MSQLSFRAHHSALARLWHWADLAVVTGLLITVLLRKTVLSARGNATLIQSQLQDLGATVTPDQSKKVAALLRDNLWDWHVYLGIALTLLLGLRILAELTSPAEERLLTKLKAGVSAWRAGGDPEAKHFTVVKASYVVFYACLAFMAASGLTLEYGEGLGASEGLLDTVAEVHETMLYFFLAFITLHLIGVVRSELTGAPGLVSDMVNGGPKP